MQVLYDTLETFGHHSLGKVNENDLNEWDDYGVPFSEQQYTHRPCYISLFKCEYFDQSDPPRMASYFRHLHSCGKVCTISFERPEASP